MTDFPPYRNASTQKPPKRIIELTQCSVATLLQHIYADTAVLWRGDFHQGKQLLAALKKRVRKPAKTGASPAETFHKHRLAQAQQSRFINMLLLEVGANYHIDLARAPDVQAALNDVYGASDDKAFLLPFNQLLAYVGAHEWHKRGVFIAALGGNIHVPFGVFSPLRGEYLDLLMKARLPENAQTAFDIGTGSGILAMLLAQRGIAHIIATDTNPRAIACARANVQNLNLNSQITVLEQDLLPAGQVDVIVCNPPWLPAKPSSDIETALYDPQHTMLKTLLQHAAAHLTVNGRLYLIMSDLAEHLGLRTPNELEQYFAATNWQVESCYSTRPQHRKATDPNDNLAFARQKEQTHLYVLKASS
ncbi:MAG: class I SAM-dependent methyltransferase [Alysiella sp.]|uniref:class I SAM-dependent methyltransferase n=1 Tax=Alysiella sp. TaxID=1872483 RepID=UPI0026DB32CF|nr:class I SAM-dependent methyltransferase [Alysiella sp.]MDO4433072.1 class I SAM-dependent methyltransferase [Alysiella sp.]